VASASPFSSSREPAARLLQGPWPTTTSRTRRSQPGQGLLIQAPRRPAGRRSAPHRRCRTPRLLLAPALPGQGHRSELGAARAVEARHQAAGRAKDLSCQFAASRRCAEAMAGIVCAAVARLPCPLPLQLSQPFRSQAPKLASGFFLQWSARGFYRGSACLGRLAAPGPGPPAWRPCRQLPLRLK